MESFTALNWFRAVKIHFLPGTPHFLPAGDMGGEINKWMEDSVGAKLKIETCDESPAC